MEIDLVDKKYRAVFHQALVGFTQLLLINKEVGARPPTEADIRELALSTLDINHEYFTKEHNFHFAAESIFSDFKEATDDPLPLWNYGRATPTFLEKHATEIGYITGLLHGTIITPWLAKVREFQDKEKATLLQNTQNAFFKSAATKEAAEALAAEKSMDETNMDSVISNKIALEAKEVRASLTKLEEMIRRTKISSDAQKNSKGGANTRRASNKKTNAQKPIEKTPTNPKRKSQKTKSEAAKAGEAGNATSKKGKPKNSKPPQKRKHGKTDNRKNTSKK
jgi:hypothetical protein